MKSRVLPYTIAMAVIAGVAFLTALAAQDDSAKSVSRPATRSPPSARWAGLLAVTLGLLLSSFLSYWILAKMDRRNNEAPSSPSRICVYCRPPESMSTN